MADDGPPGPRNRIRVLLHVFGPRTLALFAAVLLLIGIFWPSWTLGSLGAALGILAMVWEFRVDP